MKIPLSKKILQINSLMMKMHSFLTEIPSNMLTTHYMLGIGLISWLMHSLQIVSYLQKKAWFVVNKEINENGLKYARKHSIKEGGKAKNSKFQINMEKNLLQGEIWGCRDLNNHREEIIKIILKEIKLKKRIT